MSRRRKAAGPRYVVTTGPEIGAAFTGETLLKVIAHQMKDMQAYDHDFGDRVVWQGLRVVAVLCWQGRNPPQVTVFERTRAE